MQRFTIERLIKVKQKQDVYLPVIRSYIAKFLRHGTIYTGRRTVTNQHIWHCNVILCQYGCQQRHEGHEIHQMIITSFAVTLYGQRCRHHLVGQRVISDISVVRSCWNICSLYSESNTNLLLCLLIAVLGKSSHTKYNLTYNMAVCT